jgi:hypothetical protein
MSAIVPRSLPRSPAASRTGSFSSMGIAPRLRKPTTQSVQRHRRLSVDGAVGSAWSSMESRSPAFLGLGQKALDERLAASAPLIDHGTASDRFLLSSVLRVFLFGPNSPSGSDLWKLYVAFAAIGSLNSDTNPWRCICSRRPWESSRGKNRRRSGYVSVLNARSRWPWGLPPRARLTLPHGT